MMNNVKFKLKIDGDWLKIYYKNKLVFKTNIRKVFYYINKILENERKMLEYLNLEYYKDSIILENKLKAEGLMLFAYYLHYVLESLHRLLEDKMPDDFSFKVNLELFDITMSKECNGKCLEYYYNINKNLEKLLSWAVHNFVRAEDIFREERRRKFDRKFK